MHSTRLQALFFSWGSYVFTTLLLPLANGAARAPSFWKHAGQVFFASLALTLCAYCALRRIGRARGPDVGGEHD